MNAERAALLAEPLGFFTSIAEPFEAEASAMEDTEMVSDLEEPEAPVVVDMADEQPEQGEAEKLDPDDITVESVEGICKEFVGHGGGRVVTRVEVKLRIVYEEILSVTPKKQPSNSHTILLARNLDKSIAFLPEFVLDALISNVTVLLLSPELELKFKSWLLQFLTICYATLEHAHVRLIMLKMLSIGVWGRLTNERRVLEVAKGDREKGWERSGRRIAKLSAEERIKTERAHTFFSDLIKQFVKVIESESEESIEYCSRMLELLVDLEAQLPSRRFLHILILDHNILPLIHASNLYKSEAKLVSSVLVKLVARLDFYITFQIDDISGTSLTRQEAETIQHDSLSLLQKTCFLKMPEELDAIIFASVGSLENPKTLKSYLENLELNVLVELCKLAGIRASDLLSEETMPKELIISCIVYALKKKPNQMDRINHEPLYPDEAYIFDDSTIPNNSYVPRDVESTCLPKLNIQFLTLHDYLLRNFQLYKLESAFGVRSDIEDAVIRLDPLFNPDASEDYERTVFQGWSRMATPLQQCQIENVGVPRLTESNPSFVKVDITYSLDRYKPFIADEWDTLRPHDTLFLITIEMIPEMARATKIGPKVDTSGKRIKFKKNPEAPTPRELTGDEFKTRYGIKHVRGCEIFQVIGDDGKPVYDFPAGKKPDSNGDVQIATKSRTLRVLVDSNQYVKDLKSHKDIYEVYGSFNVIMRRSASKNNTKAVLETIRDLMQSDLVVPEWLSELLLGYGDRDSAHFTKMAIPTNVVDFGYTFLDYAHLESSFPGRDLVAIKGKNSPALVPPYQLTFPDSEFVALEDEQELTGAKKKRKSVEVQEATAGAIEVRSYRFQSLIESPKVNMIAFTPAQVLAIRSGSSTGLTMIVGPPGTGKTDVAVQIISNLYKQNPNCHMLLITRSNQALNHLFAKIALTNINSRHLLRLGHGHEDIDSEQAWGKSGRINSFLELRITLLEQVEKLSVSLKQAKDHASSCETAAYFYTSYVSPPWEEFAKLLENPKATLSSISDSFPFTAYFSQLYPDMFSHCKNVEASKQLVLDFYAHLVKMFENLETVRPFELLRTNKDRSNYLLVKEARIIAMTTTHASLKRRELEAGQMLEVETFIPLLLQTHDSDLNMSALSRVVLIGDHHQLPPIVQNLTLSKISKMDQSLFARLIRLGVPTIDLDFQGRARSCIADLYRWNYKYLKDLPLTRPELNFHNPGFGHEFQAVNVEDYHDVGESFPRPHYVQNLGEAEYVVATYMYMRLIGYPKERIAILATYNGQKELIRDILNKRCRFNPLFGVPSVSTVDQYQGSQSDFILLSLVRTKAIGHVRDVRRLIVALSRSRLGLYVFCRTSLFKGCTDLAPAFKILLSKPTHLELYPEERYGDCPRPVGEPFYSKKQQIALKGVKHMSDIVQKLATDVPVIKVKQDKRVNPV